MKTGLGFDFYGPALKALPSGDLDGHSEPEARPLAGRAKIFFRPYAAAAESPDETIRLWLCTGRVLEHWHSGTMTRRVPELHRAVPAALIYMNPQGRERARLGADDLAWVESRRGKVQARVRLGGRNRVPRGLIFVPWFDEASIHQQGDPGCDLPDLQTDRLQEVRRSSRQGLRRKARS